MRKIYSTEKQTTEINSKINSSKDQTSLMDPTDSSVMATRLSEISKKSKVLSLRAAFLC